MEQRGQVRRELAGVQALDRGGDQVVQDALVVHEHRAVDGVPREDLPERERLLASLLAMREDPATDESWRWRCEVRSSPRAEATASKRSALNSTPRILAYCRVVRSSGSSRSRRARSMPTSEDGTVKRRRDAASAATMPCSRKESESPRRTAGCPRPARRAGARRPRRAPPPRGARRCHESRRRSGARGGRG